MGEIKIWRNMEEMDVNDELHLGAKVCGENKCCMTSRFYYLSRILRNVVSTDTRLQLLRIYVYIYTHV